MTRVFILAASLLALGACGDFEQNLEEAKQGASQVAGEALRAGAAATDTRTACMLAGQSEAFCGCVERQFGTELTPEQVEAITQWARDSLASTAEQSASDNAQVSTTRQALMQCAAEGAMEGIAGEAGN